VEQREQDEAAVQLEPHLQAQAAAAGIAPQTTRAQTESASRSG
jgi:hypothetical protein